MRSDFSLSHICLRKRHARPHTRERAFYNTVIFLFFIRLLKVDFLCVCTHICLSECVSSYFMCVCAREKVREKESMETLACVCLCTCIHSC